VAPTPVLDFLPMSTHRLYYDDSYLQTFSARALTCLPAEPFASPFGTIPSWEVVLDQSAFYPTSGGQPHDVGCIADARVLDVRDEDDEIVHIVDRELATGEVEASINWPRRFDHMQQHTGQHLLSAMFHERFGLPTVSFHLGADLCTIDLRGPELSAETLEGGQRAANKAIFEDRPVTVRYGTADKLASIGVRKEVDREGILRAIEIESADLQPCGGTHVRSTGQIGMILVRRGTRIRQDWRVEFACGARAERIASADFQLLRAISDKLSCAPDDTLAAIDKVAAERDANFKTVRSVVQQLAEARAKLLVTAAPESPGGLRVVAELLHDGPSELLLLLATEIAAKEKTIALLVAEENGQLVLAQNSSAGKDLQAVLKQLSASFPCKGGGTRDFIRAKLADAKDSSAALSLAKTLVLS
jgi:alanyl-tRNA synthetase